MVMTCFYIAHFAGEMWLYISPYKPMIIKEKRTKSETAFFGAKYTLVYLWRFARCALRAARASRQRCAQACSLKLTAALY